MRNAFSAFAFFLYNSCLAIFLTYGLFFNRVGSEFGQAPVWTSMVFATFALLYSCSSLLAGFMLDQYGPSKTMLIGGMLMSVGLGLSSFANSLGVLILTYGVVAGAGTGSMWLPISYAVFEKFSARDVRRATGLVAAGTAVGSIVFAPLEERLISYVGWRGTFLALAVVVLCFAAMASTASKGIHPIKPFSLRRALKTIRGGRFWTLYLYYMMGNAFARTLVMVFTVPMLEAKGLSIFVGATALAMIGAGSVVGRMLAGLKGITEEEISALSFILQGASSIALLYSSDAISASLVSFIFGIGYGGYIPQFALLVKKYYGIKGYGSIFGVLLTSFGLGAFLGPMLGGLSLSASGGFTLMFYAAGLTSIAVGGLQLISCRRFFRAISA